MTIDSLIPRWLRKGRKARARCEWCNRPLSERSPDGDGRACSEECARRI